ncbi:GNAT family N-acetyltransferase [Streptomyces sp. CB03911]|uniref:GNAT family N-acetyltransferase n=1 Tax=Streptomyces sp. CB03911 TaxID=1804758 RepID=UPI000938F139|nr:GNAT family N-acetyltransferase [Streptomyces sp. CB03911]OKI28887.1 GCN5 family acetyltransferase [Streptomyces sp. CB03911]
MENPRPTIRPYRPADREAVYDICVRTAEAGGDATGLYKNEQVLPDNFAGPYLELEPGLAFVLDDGRGTAVGYVLGTSDTARFVTGLRERWLPQVGHLYPPPAGEPADGDELMAMLLHNPERMILPELADYPAHLHIDLLPEFQGRGFGRLLIERLLDALHRAGAERVHLGMVSANTGARAFYDRTGFHVVPVPDPGVLTYLGRSTAP